MTESFEEQELKDRLSLIETMITQGRRTTESWGWSFVLWGIAYYVAIGWSMLGHASMAWIVTMIAAGVLTGVVASRMNRSHPETTLGRSISSVWLSMGISIFILMVSLGYSGKLEAQASVAIVSAMLGMANATSSMILKWKAQFACALVWWAATITACFGTETQSSIVFLAAIFFCQIVFGIYCMIREAQMRKRQNGSQGAVHA
jgi:hypothetical protein